MTRFSLVAAGKTHRGFFHTLISLAIGAIALLGTLFTTHSATSSHQVVPQHQTASAITAVATSPLPIVTTEPTVKTASTPSPTSASTFSQEPVAAPVTSGLVLSGSTNLDLRLSQLENKLESQIAAITAAANGQYGYPSGVFTVASQSNRIDQLTNTVIHTPTLDGGSWSNANISGSFSGSFTGSVAGILAVSSLSLSTLTATGTVSLGSTTVTNLASTNTSTSTFAGGLAITGGCLSINGTCLAAGAMGAASDWRFSGTSAIAPTSTVGILVSASSTIGSGAQGGGLVISGGATTTGNAYFAGNVGIGTQSPSAPLEIYGSNSSTNLSAGGGVFTALVNADQTNGTFDSLSYRMLNSSGVVVTGTRISGVFNNHTAGAESADLALLTRNSGVLSEAARLTGAGNFGIGTTSPFAKLSVAGNSYFSGPITAASSLSAGSLSGLGSGLYGVPALITSALHAFGDSITAGNGASPSSSSYPNLLATDTGGTLTNRAISGAQACDMGDLQIFSNENPGATQNPIYTMLIGTNDAFIKGTGSYETIFNNCHQAAIAWLAIPSTYKVFGQNAAVATSTGWLNDDTYQTGIGIKSTTNGATLSIPITTTGGPVYVWYRIIDGNGGTFTYNVDGGANSSANDFTSPSISTNNGGTQGVALIRIPGIAAGSHAVNFTVTSATGAGNIVSVLGVGAPSSLAYYGAPTVFVGGVIRRTSDLSSAATLQYDADVQSNVKLLASDGLAVRFVDTRDYVNATTDMSDAVHPNNSGHSHLRDAFEAVMQFVPTSSFSGILSSSKNYVEVAPSGSNGGFLGVSGNAASLNVNRNPTNGVFLNSSLTGVQISLNATGNGTSSYVQFFTSSAANSLGSSNEVMRLAQGLSLGNSYVSTDPGAGNMSISGRLGVGTSSPGAKLVVTGSAGDIFLDNNQLSFNRNPLNGSATNSTKGSSVILAGTSASGGNLQFFTNAAPGGNISERMRIAESGNVGIGTSSPLVKLQVQNGNSGISFSANSRTALIVEGNVSQGTALSLISPASGQSSIFFGTPTNEVPSQISVDHANNETLSAYLGGATRLTIVGSSGNMGLGTTSPYAGFAIQAAPTGITATTLFAIASSTSNSTTTLFSVSNRGDVTINGSSGSTCTIGNGVGGTSCTSDERLKTNITVIPDALSGIKQLRGVTFTWADLSKDQRTYLGVIAQDVLKAFPQAVSSTTDGYLAVDYGSLIAPLIEAVKSLSDKLDTLNATISGFADNFMSSHITVTQADIQNLNADRVKTRELCIGDTCITESQIKVMLNSSGQQPEAESADADTEGTTSTSIDSSDDIGAATASSTPPAMQDASSTLAN